MRKTIGNKIKHTISNLAIILFFFNNLVVASVESSFWAMLKEVNFLFLGSLDDLIPFSFWVGLPSRWLAEDFTCDLIDPVTIGVPGNSPANKPEGITLLLKLISVEFSGIPCITLYIFKCNKMIEYSSNAPNTKKMHVNTHA